MFRFIRTLPQSVRNRYWRVCGIGLQPGCVLGPGVGFDLGFRDGRRGTVTLGPRCELARGVVLRAWGGSVAVGENVFFGEYVVVYGHGGVSIGDNTLIAMHCRIVSSNHTIPGRGGRIRDHGDVLLPTRIGADVWLGAGVTVLGGVTVGDGCVVGAGAVVASDLPPYAIAVGVPARVVRFRE